MNTYTALELQAIQSAKNQDWSKALEQNLEILEQNPIDISALNRLGVCYVQLGQLPKAKAQFNKVLEIDKSNQLAKKHLEKLKNHQMIGFSSLKDDEQFIEEPGKTKTVELHRLAGKETLSSLSVGQACVFKPKNRYVSVEVDKTYVGSLPEDLSYRLSKLIKTGNDYTCFIRSVSPATCSVFIKESVRSKENEYSNSFPVSKSQLNTLNDFSDESVPLQMEDIAPQIVITDTDEEKTLDTYQVDDQMSEETPQDDNDNS